jgi:putative multiple sugar transport system permease protein
MLQNAYVLVMACGMLLCILTGQRRPLDRRQPLSRGFDAAQLLDKAHMDPILTILIYLAAAYIIACGRASGSAICIFPFIATLAGMFLFRGLGRTLRRPKRSPSPMRRSWASSPPT